MLHVDVFSQVSNPAALAQVQEPSCGVFGLKRFFLNELNTVLGAICIPTKSETFGLLAEYYGFKLYNRTKLGLAYGRHLGKKVSVGAIFNYHGIRASGYGQASATSVALGAILHLSDRLHTGILISNPAVGRLGKAGGERIPFYYRAGLGFEASRKFFIEAAIEKEEDQPVNVNAGFQYNFRTQLLARAGISTATSSEWIALGLVIGSVRLDITASYHPQLGLTPGLLFLFNLKRNNPD